MGLKHPLDRGWVIGQLGAGAHRAAHQLATAVGAGALQLGVCTVCAKSAFKRANAGIQGSGRQIGVAAFAVGAELEHGDLVVNWGKEWLRFELNLRVLQGRY
jgi:hypothetical protein